MPVSRDTLDDGFGVAIMYQPCSPLKYVVKPAVLWCWLKQSLPSIVVCRLE